MPVRTSYGLLGGCAWLSCRGRLLWCLLCSAPSCLSDSTALPPCRRPGWAIEGAIGSTYKVDASYLSPHVNMASRLEAATKQYGASILLSDDFVRMLSPGVRCAAFGGRDR